MVPSETAVKVVRELAEKHRNQRAVRQLGRYLPSVLANVRASFAPDLSDDETPLFLLDESFLQNGKKGLLLTNRRLYSNGLTRPIPLDEIVAAVVEYPTSLQVGLFLMLLGPFLGFFFRRRNMPRLIVNGYQVYRGPFGGPLLGGRPEFLTELLTRLAALAHSTTGPLENCR